MAREANNVGNVYCIGRNYALHAKEMGSEAPASPIVFLKPTHAVLPLSDTLVLPADAGEVHFETEIVLRVGKPYKSGMSADRLTEELIDAMTIGIDLTLRDVQSELKKKGLPWLAAKGFRHSAPVGPWMTFPGLQAAESTEFALRKNGDIAQRGFASDMIFPFGTLLRHLGETYGLDAGDIVFTGTPEGVGALRDGDALELVWDGQAIGGCVVQMK